MTLVLTLLLAPLILVTFCFGVEVFAGLAPLPPCATDVQIAATCVVVVPAHDEAAILDQRLTSLMAAAAGHARILLVADNCADSTAEIGRALGAEVIERCDSCRRGKGFALDFARAHLAESPPDLVLVIDADCMTDGASIARLIASCVTTGRPCQAINLQSPSPQSSPRVQLSTFAFFIKNVVRQRGLQRLAARAQLLGTGMAFPWTIFSKAALATEHIVEDLKLGQELAAAGHPPLLIEGATIWSNAETERNTLSQRSRWEGGFLQNALQVAPRVFVASLARADLRGAWSGLSLMVPPLALLCLADAAAILLGMLVAALAGAATWPVLALAMCLAAAAVAVALAWLRGGSRFVGLGSLAQIPLYVLWKLPLYVGLIRRGVPKEWLRTGRSS